MMKIFKQILLTTAFVAAISVTASAQKDGDKKPPPKEKPPVIVPKEKPKEDKPKKPDGEFFVYREETIFE